MTKKTAVEIENEDEGEGQVIDGSAINVRVSVQQYVPDGRRYQEIKGTATRIRFTNAKAVTTFTKKLREAIPDLL